MKDFLLLSSGKLVKFCIISYTRIYAVLITNNLKWLLIVCEYSSKRVISARWNNRSVSSPALLTHESSRLCMCAIEVNSYRLALLLCVRHFPIAHPFSPKAATSFLFSHSQPQLSSSSLLLKSSYSNKSGLRLMVVGYLVFL